MKLLSFIIAMLFLVACKPCNDPSAPPLKVAYAIEAAWSCQNHAQVEHDVEAWFESRNMCTAPAGARGVLASLVCPVAVEGLREWAAGQVPTNWECDSSKVGRDAAMGLTALCELIPF